MSRLNNREGLELKPRDWRIAVIKDERWVLRFDPPATLNAMVSFGLEGENAKIEHLYWAHE